MRDLARPLPFAAAARIVFGLALDRMIWARRSLAMAVLVGAPVLLAVAYRVLIVAAARPTPPRSFYGDVVFAYWIAAVLPLVSLFFATSLIAEEVDERTLTYLLTRPLTRASMLVGKFAAYLVTAFTLALPSVVLTFFVVLGADGWSAIAASAGDLFRDLGAVALTLVAYGALFTLLGIVLRRPVLSGLAFLGVEFFMAALPGYLPRFTFTAWLRSLVQHRPAQEGLAGLFQQVLPAGQALAVLSTLSVLLLATAVAVFSRREYVMEQ